MVDYAGAAVGTAFGELLALVKHLVKTVAAFRDELKKIRATLGVIEPIIKDIDNYNNRLSRGPEEMAPIRDLLEEGKGLVSKCSKIHALNLHTKYTHSKKLTDLNAAVVEKFQLYMPLLNARDEKELLVDVKEIGGDVKEVKDLLISVISNSVVLQRRPEALGDLAVPDFIVGSEVEASSSKLRKLCHEVATEGSTNTLWRPPYQCRTYVGHQHASNTQPTRDQQVSNIRHVISAPNTLATRESGEGGGGSVKDTSEGNSAHRRSHMKMAFWRMKCRRLFCTRSAASSLPAGEVGHDISTADWLQFDFGTIRAATDNFSYSKKLGEGGFGAVYMGRLPNGQEIAVKRLSQHSCQGEVEFKNEVMLLARLQHRNLVELLGFCPKGVERLLIYEFVPNSSLDQFIFDPMKRTNLKWDRRHKIIMGVARGMLYLHEDSRHRIIHRDLKASNILLDSDMNPKISDFGMARLFKLDQTQAVTCRVVGTYGYMAPEYVMNGIFSVKSDVFSFGVLVLEMVSGQRSSSFRMGDDKGDDTGNLISYVWKNWREGSMSNIIDPSINSGSSTEIARCIHIGLLCIQENAASRPTMASVLVLLNSHSITLQVPSRPAFLMHSGIESDMSTGEVVHDISTADSLQFNFDTIRAATDNFSDSKKLGQGGFGAVYMGQLSNGQEIAVKRLSRYACQGEVEFKNEVMLLARLQHRNLVKLLGFCLEGVEQLLIYEFVPNSSLDQFIFDPMKRTNLDWDRRHKIIMGVARGTLYLHEDFGLPIIHRDLKASNILVDSDMNPKISDFDMVRLFELDQTQAKANRIVGTYGYMAPEYVMNGIFSVKSDVFNFGVLVLEIVSGQRNNLFRMGDDTGGLLSYVWKNWREGSIWNIIDPSINSGSRTEIARCIHIGLLCVQEDAASRPTMLSVLLMLNSHLVTLQVPSRPAFFMHSGIESDTSSMQDYSSRVSEVERSRSKSNQISKIENSMTDHKNGSLSKWEISVPCALLFAFVVVFGLSNYILII